MRVESASSATLGEREAPNVSSNKPPQPDHPNRDDDLAAVWPDHDKPVTPRPYSRRKCPSPTPLNPPKRISKKAINGGRCDYLDPDGKHCSHWQAPDSEACYCHFDAYMERFPFDMPRPRTKKSRGAWKKQKPVIAVKMTRNDMWQKGWHDAP